MALQASCRSRVARQPNVTRNPPRQDAGNWLISIDRSCAGTRTLGARNNSTKNCKATSREIPNCQW